MTKKELNKGWEQLWLRYHDKLYKIGTKKITDKEYYEDLELQKAKYKNLYYADNEFNATTLESFKIAVVLNRKLRVIPLHTFGLYIDIPLR